MNNKITLLLALISVPLFAASKTAIKGFASYNYSYNDDESAFGSGSISPIFLWSTNNTLFETELEISLGDEPELEIGYANLGWEISPNLTIRMGKFLSPIGIFGEKIHPSWINRFVDMPPGFGHGSWLPASEIGIEARGALRLQSQKVTYSLFVSNGQQLDTLKATLSDSHNENNKGKAVGGRFSYLPLSNGSLEIGVSGKWQNVGSAESRFENVDASLASADLMWLLNFNGIGSFNLQSQYNYLKISSISYLIEGQTLTPSNTRSNSFASVSFKPDFINSEIVRNFELTSRYSMASALHGTSLAEESTQLVGGIKTNVIFGGAEGGHGDDGHSDEENSSMDDEMTSMPMESTEEEGGHGISFDHPTYKLQIAVGF